MISCAVEIQSLYKDFRNLSYRVRAKSCCKLCATRAI